MKTKFQPFATALIGSMPRSQAVATAKADLAQKKISHQEYDQILLQETQKVVQLQTDAGLDIIVDGELGRDNYMSFVADKVPGIELKSLAEISQYISDKVNFEKSLEESDVTNAQMNNPVVTQRIDVNAHLEDQEVQALQTLTKKPIKVTIPSPYLLTRTMWLEEITGEIYEDRQELGQDVVQLLSNEVRRLIAAGVDIIQMDEPILSDVVFNQDQKSDSFY
ncbi:uncharacterized protein JG30_01340 [Bombilactobacillus mellifer]|uniref:Cobalamin-independent methionine synthase MetE C-terminal/archaeal domain-containing protein n=2 Tax=Bombilactobacillus mellifer TaxID=1218492 RepID=A0A0F4LX89_9LACO|nr:uncharacterized protein JG30_01340 [Bombilactobacillus mellifer]